MSQNVSNKGSGRAAEAQRRLSLWAAGERGDVPGWVLVAVMTAGLVTTLWVAADDQLTAMLQQAIDSVSK